MGRRGFRGTGAELTDPLGGEVPVGSCRRAALAQRRWEKGSPEMMGRHRASSQPHASRRILVFSLRLSAPRPSVAESALSPVSQDSAVPAEISVTVAGGKGTSVSSASRLPFQSSRAPLCVCV